MTVAEFEKQQKILTQIRNLSGAVAAAPAPPPPPAVNEQQQLKEQVEAMLQQVTAALCPAPAPPVAAVAAAPSPSAPATTSELLQLLQQHLVSPSPSSLSPSVSPAAGGEGDVMHSFLLQQQVLLALEAIQTRNQQP